MGHVVSSESAFDLLNDSKDSLSLTCCGEILISILSLHLKEL